MIIPETFQQYARLVHVVKRTVLKHNETEVNGLCHSEKNLIELEASMPQDKLENIYCHELVHMILEKMGEHKLSESEKFVDVFSGLLHQALVTGKGGLK